MDRKLKIIGIIPSRYASTRFPGKPLIDILGKSMIERVYMQAKRAHLLDEVVVATDDERIQQAVVLFGGNVVMTSSSHSSGTDRCMEVVLKSNENWDIAINIQGDEPLIFPEQIDQLATRMMDGNYGIGTLIKRIDQEADLQNPNVVKVVINKLQEALYFSRSAIPYNRTAKLGQWLDGNEYFKHIGLYGYRTNILNKITSLSPSRLEITETLEQLRWLENGYNITTAQTGYENISVDAPSDLEQVLKILNGS